MKKYKRSELYALLKECDVISMCEEFYAEIDKTDFKPMQSGDKYVMKRLKAKIESFQNANMYASIVIVDKNVPILVVHRRKINPEHDLHSIREIHIPYQGEEINQINFKIYEVQNILDILSEDDYDPGYTYNKSYEGLRFL